jgi:hypothetical protein
MDNEDVVIRDVEPDFLDFLVTVDERARSYFRREGFVFGTDVTKPSADRTEAERWEMLAFTLYTDLCEIASRAEALRDA